MTTENENQNNETEAAAPATAPAEQQPQARPPRPFNRPPRPGFRPGGPGAGTEDGEGGPEGGQPGGGGGFGGGGYGGRSGGPGGARRPRRPGGKERFAPRRKVCQFCVDQIREVDYKDFQRLRRFLSDRGKIEPRRKTGTCARHQRSLTTAIKRGRYMALLPYVVNQSR